MAFKEEQRCHLAAFTGQDVVSSASRRGVHALKPNAAFGKVGRPSSRDKPQTDSAPEKNKLRVSKRINQKISRT
jgi:hypothetical protein